MGLSTFLSGRASPQLVALDISNTRIKLLALSGNPERFQIEAYANEALPAGAVRDHQIAEPELVSQAIVRALKRSGCRHKRAAVAVSGSAVISKVIDMPITLSEGEIEEQIGFEADAYIPYPIDEVSLDFHMLGPSGHDPAMQRVLLAACRRETVERRVAAVAMAGLDTGLVDVEAYALQNACGLLLARLADGGATRTLAVVDLGATTTTVNVLHHGDNIYTREQNFGGQHLVEEIQRHYQLESHDQALAKLRANELDAAFGERALPRFIAQVAQQIDRSLQVFFSHAPEYERIDQLLLVGGCALLPGIEAGVAQELGIETMLGNPLAGMRASSAARRNRVESEAPALMVAAGLAMRAAV